MSFFKSLKVNDGTAASSPDKALSCSVNWS
jgi:hypothetical protein